MTNLTRFQDSYIPVKTFLSSYRALSDGSRGVKQLQEMLEAKGVYLWNWKITWIGTCTILRTAIDLFKLDGKSCLSQDLRREIREEWNQIKRNEAAHPIYWQFLQKERNNVVHEYHWSTYEAWIKPDGSHREITSLLSLYMDDGASPLLLMRGGYYHGQNSVELLSKATEWVEDRIFSAIHRAGLSPDEYRNVLTFAPQPAMPEGLMGVRSVKLGGE